MIARRRDITRLRHHPVRNKIRIDARIGDTIEITNLYTAFSLRKQTRNATDTTNIHRDITNYDRDKFGIVSQVSRGKHQGEIIDKVHFITDSGKETWRGSNNVIVHHGQRGIISHSKQHKWWNGQSSLESNKPN